VPAKADSAMIEASPNLPSDLSNDDRTVQTTGLPWISNSRWYRNRR